LAGHTPLHAWRAWPLENGSGARRCFSYDQRIALDGTPAETVDAESKDLAATQLPKLAARKAAKQVAKPAAPAAVKLNPAPAPPTDTPEQLRDRVRASLLRRRA
jgi:sRNA-binding protein